MLPRPQYLTGLWPGGGRGERERREGVRQRLVRPIIERIGAVEGRRVERIGVAGAVQAEGTVPDGGEVDTGPGDLDPVVAADRPEPNVVAAANLDLVVRVSRGVAFVHDAFPVRVFVPDLDAGDRINNPNGAGPNPSDSGAVEFQVHLADARLDREGAIVAAERERSRRHGQTNQERGEPDETPHRRAKYQCRR